MKNNKWIIVALFTVLSTSFNALAANHTGSFDATDINNGTTKDDITISQKDCSKENKQVCKDGNTKVKEDVIQCGNTASTVNEKYVEIKATTDILSLRVHGVANSSDAKEMAFVYWGNAEPSYDNVKNAAKVKFVGYDKACDGNYVDVNIPAGVRIIRIYRQLKNFNGTGYEKNKTYGDGQTYYLIDVDVVAAPSSDATLKNITYNGLSIEDFESDKLNYQVSLPAGTTDAPVVAAETNDSKANVTTITQPNSPTGKATILVTAEDGTTTKTYTVQFSVEPAIPQVQSVTWSNIRGSAYIDEENKTISGSVFNGSSMLIEPQFTGKYLDVKSPTGRQDFSTGPVSYTFTSSTNETTTYVVTIKEAEAVSSDATLRSLTVAGHKIKFKPTQYGYDVTLKEDETTVPEVTYEVNDFKATAQKIDAEYLPGITKIVVTAENKSTQTYSISFSANKIPSTTLATHIPGIYEAKSSEDGYGEALSVYNSREYEVYILGRDADSKAGIFTKKGLQLNKGSDSENALAIDWLTAESSKGLDGSARSIGEEFENAIGKGNLKMQDGDAMILHVQGFDQFTLWGKDAEAKTDNNKYLKIYVDDLPLPARNLNASDGGSIRRYDIPTGEHVIKVTCPGASTSKPYGFSLRIAQEPKTKRLKGNDSTQVVLQTMAVRPVTYVTKYNNIPGAETKLEWKGTPATGVELKEREGSLADTLVLSGTVACPVGIYNYAVVSYLNGVETSRAEGKFTVKSDIMTLSSSTDANVYQGEEMDPIEFQYYALNASDVKLTWENNQAPAGIAGKGTTAGKYVISGTPKTKGTYNYSITVTDADTTIKGTITVEELNYGNNPVLYLFKNDNAPDKDGVYKYLTSQGKNLIKRKAKEEGLRPADQYQKYNWVLISEDVDADNKEVLALARGQGGLPVLNMKSFTYTEGRLNWGEPDNGSLSSNGRSITVQREDHPIFKALNKKRGDQIMVLDTVIRKGLMPINVNYSGTLCLATALTRDKEDYYGDGPEQTILHEVPASMNLGQKYICLPIGAEGSNRLTNDGKKLIDQCIKYILSNEATTITVPQIAITKFKIGSYEAKNIDDGNHLIEINVEVQDSDAMKAATPEITLASPLTFYTADKQYVNADGTVDFSNWHYGVRYVVSDYINSWYYDVVINLYDPHEGIENIEVGTWVNIYDIYGRKVATTNEDLRTMALPQGMYIVVTEDGQTIKIMK